MGNRKSVSEETHISAFGYGPGSPGACPGGGGAKFEHFESPFRHFPPPPCHRSVEMSTWNLSVETLPGWQVTPTSTCRRGSSLIPKDAQGSTWWGWAWSIWVGHAPLDPKTTKISFFLLLHPLLGILEKIRDNVFVRSGLLRGGRTSFGAIRKLFI